MSDEEWGNDGDEWPDDDNGGGDEWPADDNLNDNDDGNIPMKTQIENNFYTGQSRSDEEWQLALDEYKFVIDHEKEEAQYEYTFQAFFSMSTIFIKRQEWDRMKQDV